MSNLNAHSVGLGVETTWGTPVTVTRWYEADVVDFDIEIPPVYGSGLQNGSRYDATDRHTNPTAWGAGTIGMDCTTRGMGLLWEAALGVGASTLVSGSTYQQNFTPLATSPLLPPRTIQTGVVDTTGSVSAVTYEGCSVSEWTFTLDNAGLARLETQWDAENWSTATAYTTPTYTASNNLYHFGHGATGAMMIGGTFTAPTTTTLGSTSTAVTNVRSFTVTNANGLQSERFNIGGAGRKSRQLAGKGELTGTIEAEFDAVTMRDLYLNQTAFPMVLTLTSAESLSTGTAQLSIALPSCRLLGEMPKPTPGEITVLSLPFKTYWDRTNAPITVSMRTADTAL